VSVLVACAGTVGDAGPVVGPPDGPSAHDRSGGPAGPDPDRDPPTSPGADGPARGLPPSETAVPLLELGEVASLDAPIDTAVLPDGTVLVAERAGAVRVLIGSDGVAPARGQGGVLIDVRERTTTDSERGLLAIAITPGGDELLLSLTDLKGDTLIEAHPLDGDRVTGPPRTVYALPQPRANHNGGSIVFAPDGMLLIGLGDGGGSGDPDGAGQDLSTPLGSILRRDIRGARTVVPRDNPFVDRVGAAPEIAAYGLRNP